MWLPSSGFGGVASAETTPEWALCCQKPLLPVDGDMAPAQQSNALLSAWRAARIVALRFGVVLVLAQHVAVTLHPRDAPRPLVSRCPNAVAFAILRILIDPLQRFPPTWVGLVGCNQMELLGIDADRIALSALTR
jgi:hypothetical protein